MKHRARFMLLMLSAVPIVTGCGNGQSSLSSVSPARGTLVGAWRSKITFRNGAPSSNDWWSAGHGILTETITLSDDGQSYASTITLATYDRADTPITGGGEGTGAGTRIVF
jgi:hypothetical protein